MANGSKDWQSQVNISAQDLDKITNRPSYGAAVHESFVFPVIATETKYCLTVIGKGVIYGGNFGTTQQVKQGSNRVLMAVDGIELKKTNIDVDLQRGVYQIYTSPLYLILYNDVEFRYNYGIMPGLTFESSVVLKFLNNGTYTDVVAGTLIYALV